MARNIEEEIQAAERRLEATLTQMERIQQDFVAASVDLIKAWYWTQTESVVKREAEVTKKLGVERLSELKADVRALQEDTGKIVTEFLQDESLWWHRKQGEQSYFYHGNRPPDGLDKAVRLSAGRLASVLEQYGYLPADLQDHGVWREWDQSGNYHPSNARPYYPHGFDWSEQMRALIKDYEELHREAPRQAREIERLKQEKAQNEAEDLWKKA